MVLSHEEDYDVIDPIYNSTVKYERQDYFILGDAEEGPEVQPQSLTNKKLPADDYNSVWSSAQKIRFDQPGDASVPFVYKSKRAEDEALDYNNQTHTVGEQIEPGAIETESGSEDDSAILVEQTIWKCTCAGAIGVAF